MQPRNDREREVARLSHKLPTLTKSQRGWIRDSVVGTRIYRANRRCWCSACGHSWEIVKGEDAPSVCPHCGAKAEVRESRKLTENEFTYVRIFQVFKGWQVIRYFVVDWDCKKGRERFVHWCEVMQKWCQPGRPMITMGVPMKMAAYYQRQPFSIWGELSIKNNDDEWHWEWMTVHTYPRKSFLPLYIKHLGRNPDFSVYKAPILLGDIFSNSYLEGLWMRNEAEKIRDSLNCVEYINKFWPSVRVAVRHGFEPEHWATYIDYLRALRFLHYDMRSPRYVAPPDWEHIHDLVMRQYRNKREAMERRREEARRLQYALMQEELARQREEELKTYGRTFAERVAKFADLKIEDMNIIILPLMTIEAFKEEGDAMHHCVFNMGYYNKPASLILSARRKTDGERVETIEVNLKNYTIAQSRGFANGITERHDEICNLVTDAMPAIRKMAMARA